MINDEDICPTKKRARNIYLDSNPSISVFGNKFDGTI